MDEADREKKTNMDTINEFKLIRQRLDVQLNVAKQELDSLKVTLYGYWFSSGFLEHLFYLNFRIKFQIVPIAPSLPEVLVIAVVADLAINQPARTEYGS